MKQCLEKLWHSMLQIKLTTSRNLFIVKIAFLTPALTRIPCNALPQPHFDYACSAWCPNPTKKLKHRIQTTQSKCMRFCLQLVKLKHRSYEESERLNHLPMTYRFK